jgi:ketosteroid isomerase-like protein
MGRDSVSSGFRYVADQADFTRFKLEEIESVNIQGDLAILTGILEAKAVLRGQTRIDGTYRTEFTWKKASDGWKITKVSMRPATDLKK